MKIKSSDLLQINISDEHEYNLLREHLTFGKWVFRGHSDSRWKLETSLERYCKRLRDEVIKEPANNQLSQHAKSMKLRGCNITNGMEYDAIDQFCKYVRKSFEKRIDALCMMQHYGSPTRLLDFTFSIDVALFFAFEQLGLKTTPCIWCLDYVWLKEKFTSSHIQYKTRLNCKEEDLSDEERDNYEYEIQMEFDSFMRDQHRFRQACLDAAEEAISPDENKIYNSIIPITPIGNNERLVAQNGLFLFPQNFYPFEDNLKQLLELKQSRKWPKNRCLNDWFSFGEKCTNPSGGLVLSPNVKVLKIVFPRMEFRCKMAHDILYKSNINKMRLFPGIAGIAESIDYGGHDFLRSSGPWY